MADNKVPQSRISGLSESLDAADELFEYDSRATFPAQGKAGKIYVDKLNNLLYRWDDTASDYVEVSAAVASESGTSNYEELTNLPLINGVQVVGNKSLADLGIASLDLNNLSTAGIDVIKSYAGSSSGSNTALAVNPFSYGMSSYFTSEPDSSCWTKADNTFISNAKYYEWLEKIQTGALSAEGVSVKLSAETYTDYDFVINTTDRTFRLPLLDGSEDLLSNRYTDLELKASGSTYIAPANGRYSLIKSANGSEQFLCMTNQSSGEVTSMCLPINTGSKMRTWIDCKKGQTVLVEYRATGATVHFRFIYAQGNGSLYYYTGATENTLSEDVESLKSQVGDISAILDNINGEVL